MAHGVTIYNLVGNQTTEESNYTGFSVSFTPYSLPHLLTISIFLSLIILATIIGNVFVIAAILLERNLQHIQNYLVLSLAVADLMVAALVMPLALLNDVSKEWFLGAEICDMYISFDVICCTSSILHLVCIALDRYWTVTRIEYINSRSTKRILIMVLMSWLISICISVPPLFGWKDGNHHPDLTGECIISQDWGYTVYSTVGAFYLPLFFIIVIYFKIFRAAKSTIRKKHLKTYKDLASNMKPLIATNRMRSVTQMTSQETERLAINGSTNLHSSIGALSSSPDSSNGSMVGETHFQDNCQETHLDGDDVERNTPSDSPLLEHKSTQNNNQLAKPVTIPSSPESPLELPKTGNFKSSLLDITRAYLDKTKISSPALRKKTKPNDPRNKLEAKRERKAAQTLAIITGTFVGCWLPFFILAIVRPFCGDQCYIDPLLQSVASWLGYFNSLLNPVIYTIFNPDFRLAFRKILFGQYKGRRMH